MILLHLLAEDEWRGIAPGAVSYSPASLGVEGFAHCTVGDELMLQVASTFYGDAPSALLVLSLDADRLTSEVRWEPPSPAPPDGSDATRFPHVYGPLDLAAVVSVRRLRRDRNGRFSGYGPYESD